MMKIIGFLFLMTSINGFSQKEWTLQECLDSALLNNNRIGISNLNITISEEEEKASKLNFIPRINGSASHGYNWGQTIDPFTNQFATDRVQYNTFFLSTSANLFSGLRDNYSRKLSKVNHEIASENLKLDQFEITLNLLAAYLQAKLNEKIVEVNIGQVSYSEQMLQKANTLVDLEHEVESTLLEAKSTLADDRTRLILTQSEYKRSLITLKSIMGSSLDTTYILLSDSIYCDFSAKRNDLTTLNELYLKQKNLNTSISKSQLYPTLSLSGSLGSGYSENNKFIAPNGEFIPRPFSDQFEENFYQSISATLSIPIFSGSQTYSRIKIDQLEYQQALLESESRLRDEVEIKLSTSLELINAEKELESSIEALNVNKLLFEHNSLKYEKGLINYFEFIQSKNKLYESELNKVNAQYMFEFKKLVFGLYR